jgi:hypothetical protein
MQHARSWQEQKACSACHGHPGLSQAPNEMSLISIIVAGSPTCQATQVRKRLGLLSMHRSIDIST